VLLRIGAIVRVRQAGHQLHFSAATPRFEREALCVLRVPSVRDVVHRLYQGSPPSSSALAAALGITGRTARRALRLLASRGLLRIEERADGGKAAHLHPSLRVLIAREIQLAAQRLPDAARSPGDTSASPGTMPP